MRKDERSEVAAVLTAAAVVVDDLRRDISLNMRDATDATVARKLLAHRDVLRELAEKFTIPTVKVSG